MSRLPDEARSVSSGSESDDDDQTWDDWHEDPVQARSLFDDSSFASVQGALQHDKEVHGFDLPLIASTLDFFERIRLINWIRSTKPDPKSLARLDRNADFLQDDKFLKPVLDDDVVLQVDFDEMSLSDPAPSASTSQAAHGPSQNELVEALKAQLADSNAAMEQLKRIIRERVGDSMGLDQTEQIQQEPVVNVSRSDKGKGVADKPERDDDTHYFESYAYNEIHEIMLKDKVRTDSYRDFILNNPSIFKGAVVLDVGCGSGILSMFAAKAGARKVYAVDASAVAFKAERNIKANGLSDVITVVKGKVENIDLPEKVDVIVSEWMGYFLLYECMLDSVLHARDRFMKPSGLMVPSQTSIMLSLFGGQQSLIADRIDFWNDVYGFKMQSMKDEIYDEALIEIVRGDDVVSNEVSISDIVTQTVAVKELEFVSDFTLTATSSTRVNAFLGHFDTFFTSDGRKASAALGAKDLKDGSEVFFSTGAKAYPTHWKQSVFLLRQPFDVKEGTVVSGTFKCSKNPDNSRELVCEVTWTVDGGRTEAQVWKVR